MRVMIVQKKYDRLPPPIIQDILALGFESVVNTSKLGEEGYSIVPIEARVSTQFQSDQLVTLTTFTSFLIRSLIHREVWPKQETFGDVYTTYMSYIKRHYGDEVTVVVDGYTESSVNTKVIERQRRRMKRTSREIIFNEITVLLGPQRQFCK
ncbi:hypothetical protein AVEN_221532-1 [Araneus ventricosus]|uniref:Uncharacterized protein n=1 Tax=Araneus ventricosus TaxID=182803 RepID=A0A4Y2J3X4_ARAVE|nr:hypothetical protein AVEN_221532-1 [Araneus ventricosus]